MGNYQESQAVACLWIEHFPFQLHMLTAVQPDLLRGRPVIIASQALGVVDASPEAAERGINQGMPLRQAMARTRDGILIEPDLALYRREWEKILTGLHQRSPIVEDAGPGHAYLGLNGLARLYGANDANLASAIRSAVPPMIEARLGLGPGVFPAYVAALEAMPNRAFKISADSVTVFLASKTVKLLPVPWEVRERLIGFGLRNLGQVAAQQVGPLQAQFGPTGRLIWEMARGIDRRVLTPYQTLTTIEESLAFPIPTSTIEPILLAARSLLERSYRRSELHGRFARVSTLRGDVLNGRPWLRRIPFREAMGSAERAFHPVKYALADISLPGPLETLSLTLTGITGEAGTQLNLYVDVRKRENLVEAIRQVQERTGGRIPIYQVQEMEPDSWHPERRHALMAYGT